MYLDMRLGVAIVREVTKRFVPFFFGEGLVMVACSCTEYRTHSVYYTRFPFSPCFSAPFTQYELLVLALL